MCCGVCREAFGEEMPNVVINEGTPERGNCMDRVWEWVRPRKCYAAWQLFRVVTVVASVASMIAAGYFSSRGETEKVNKAAIACAGSIMAMGIAFAKGLVEDEVSEEDSGEDSQSLS
jgi:hypothetical protein